MNGYQAHAGVKFTATMMMAALFGMALTNLFVRSSMGVLAPELASGLDLSPFILGAIAFFFAYALFQIPGGMLLDRFGPRSVIVGLFFFYCSGYVGVFLRTKWDHHADRSGGDGHWLRGHIFQCVHAYY